MAAVACAQVPPGDLSEPTEDIPRPLPTVDPPETFALADVEQIALKHNPTLVSAGAHIEAARGQWIQAGLFPNPVAGYHGTEIGNRNARRTGRVCQSANDHRKEAASGSGGG